jgi:hypothetical protein
MPPEIPEPKADQELPFQRAMLVADTPPAIVKLPPAYKLVPDTAIAETVPFIPEPNAAHKRPFHSATLLANILPAMLKEPPM